MNEHSWLKVRKIYLASWKLKRRKLKKFVNEIEMILHLIRNKKVRSRILMPNAYSSEGKEAELLIWNIINNGNELHNLQNIYIAKLNST